MNARLAPGLVWPVSRAELRNALGDLADSVEVVWLSWVKQPSATPVAAAWVPLVDVLPDYPARERGITIRVHPVAKGDHRALRDVVRTQVLPDLARWCRAALAAPEGWQLMRHERRWSVTGDQVSAAEREGVAALRLW